MAHHFEEQRRQAAPRSTTAPVNLGIAVDVEKKDGTRTLMVPGDPRRRPARLRRLPRRLRRADRRRRATNKLTADDLQGANISLTNPGGIGTIASVPRLMTGQGDDRRHRLDRLPGRAAARTAGADQALGAEKVMTMTSTYDHRIIQGAESGALPAAASRQLPAGRGRLLRAASFADARRRARRRHRAARARLRAAAGARRRRRAAAGAAGAAPDEELLQAVQAATSLLKAHRTHGHLAARLDPLGSRARGRPGARAREPSA